MIQVKVQDLRVGMFVHIDLGWMDHPFPLNKFRIANPDQIGVIRSLGLTQVSVDRPRSAPGVFDVPAPPPVAPPDAPPTPAADAAAAQAQEQALQRRAQLQSQNASLAQCDRRFSESVRVWKQAFARVQREPQAAAAQCQALVDGFLNEMNGEGETYIRLLSEASGDGSALHALNVTVVSLLLGRALNLDAATLQAVGMGALLHDVGKLALPERLRLRTGHKLTPMEERAAREHVPQGVLLGRAMGLDRPVLEVIAQHHEMFNATGYPGKLEGSKMSAAARVVSLVNVYDNLCNPSNPALAMTPHETLSVIFAQMKPQFELSTLNLFIRIMGVYPPGSVVQLNDERYALVVSVNASRPLKPRVVVHDAKVPRDEALVVDLQDQTALSIRRSLHPRHLPRTALDYLSPRQRVCYFFERATQVNPAGEPLAAGGPP